MMHTIHLHGYMAEKYGKTVTMSAANLFQLMRGLVSRFGPQFKEDVRVGRWHLTDGAVKSGNDIAQDDVRGSLLFKHKHVHLLPEVVGASAALRVIVGIVLIIAGVYFEQPWMVQLGASMVLGGVAEMLTKPPKTGGDKGQENKGSYIYNSAVNVTTQGGPIPLGYGRVSRASSVLITTDFSSDEIT